MNARVVVLAILLLSPAILHSWQDPAEVTAAEKEITSTLRQMYAAEKRKDLQFVLAHLSEDFAEVAGDGGIYHRSDIEQGWPDVVVNDYQVSDCVFKMILRDAAYLSCAMALDATFKGKPFPQHFRVTTLWTRQQGPWQIRFEQGTVIPQTQKSE